MEGVTSNAGFSFIIVGLLCNRQNTFFLACNVKIFFTSHFNHLLHVITC